MATPLSKWFRFNVDGHNTRVDETPVLAMVVVEAVASMVVLDVVVGVATDVVADDRQSKSAS